MRKEDVKIGMKVVPFRKTVGSRMTSSGELKSAKERNQPFLYVIHWSSFNCWSLSADKKADSGDWFKSGDFRKYKPDRVHDGPLTMEFLNG